MRELLETTSSKELLLWQAYDSIDPIGPERDDLRTAIIASTVANYIGSAFGGKKFKPLKVQDFIPKFDEPPPQERPVMTGEEIAAQAAIINAMFGGLDLRAQSNRPGDFSGNVA